jgi:hypothetical protein
MLPGWQPCVIVATLYDIRDGPAVDLKIESQIPSKVRRPENEQMPTRSSAGGSRSSGGGSNRSRADASKNQEEPAGRVIF